MIEIKRATFIGRFQPLHRGHVGAIESVKQDYELVIAIGSPRKARTARNPLNLEERKELLDKVFPELEKVAVEDEDRGEKGHREWGRKLVNETGAEKVVSRNKTVIDIIEKHTDADIVKHELQDPERYSGTRIRRKMRKGEEWSHLVPESTRTKSREYKDIVEEACDGSR